MAHISECVHLGGLNQVYKHVGGLYYTFVNFGLIVNLFNLLGSFLLFWLLCNIRGGLLFLLNWSRNLFYNLISNLLSWLFNNNFLGDHFFDGFFKLFFWRDYWLNMVLKEIIECQQVSFHFGLNTAQVIQFCLLGVCKFASLFLLGGEHLAVINLLLVVAATSVKNFNEAMLN